MRPGVRPRVRPRVGTARTCTGTSRAVSFRHARMSTSVLVRSSQMVTPAPYSQLVYHTEDTERRQWNLVASRRHLAVPGGIEWLRLERIQVRRVEIADRPYE